MAVKDFRSKLMSEDFRPKLMKVKDFRSKLMSIAVSEGV